MFQRATKRQSYLRGAFFGPSGGGKTYSGLRVLAGIGGRVAVIDTERGSAAKYSDRFTFDVCELRDRSVDGYVAAIREAAEAGYECLLIDSLSHAWHSLNEEVERLARAKYRGNTWSAWAEGTPRQRRLVDAILDFPGHLIATMRSRTEWTTTENDRGSKTPVRVGLSPEQGKGIEYEFDVLVEISAEHVARVIKDRSGRFQDRILDRPGEEFGAELAAWLRDGEPAARPAALDARVVVLGEFPDFVKARCRDVMRAAIESGATRDQALDQAVAVGREMLAAEPAEAE